MRSIISWFVSVAIVSLNCCLSAQVEDDPDRVRQELQSLAQMLQNSPQTEDILRGLPVLSRALRNEDTAFDALPLAEKAAETLLLTATQSNQWPVVVSLLKSAARMRFEQAEPDKAGEHLQSLLGMYQSLGEQPQRGFTAEQRARWSYEVALEYLRGEQTKAALELLGEIVDLDVQSRSEFDHAQAAVAGALNRRIEQLSTDERFDLLYAWTMPSEKRPSVRIFASRTSIEAPPDVFARALGERPHPNAFPVPQVSGVEGLFSTASSLVRAAAESGRLRRVTTELEELTKTGVPGAEYTLLLARIADESFSVEELRGLLESRLEELSQPQPEPLKLNGEFAIQNNVNASPELVPWPVIGAACLERNGLQATSQAVFARLIKRANTASANDLLPFLRRAEAFAILQLHAGASSDLLTGPKLKFWIPASEENAARSAAGAVREVWLAHEDHILHLAGPRNDYLCFRYPLTGDFVFHVEAQNGGQEHTFGNLAFGGLAYEVAGNTDEFRVWGLDMGKMITRPMPFVRKEQWPTYQRLTLRSSAEGVQHLVNGHPVWTDPLPLSTSPWLALRCFGHYVPAFRNFRLTGDPVIPREVRMSDGNMLRGWFANFYPSHVSDDVPIVGGRSTIAASDESGSRQPLVTPPQFDWFIRDGVIYGAQRGEPFRAAIQSRLTYFRPVQDEESISYEFLYEPGKHEVHPSLGRLAFLIEPNGVRVHWMTSGETEWTGLAENNATLEPLNRRGPRPLPLKVGQWNQATLSLDRETLTLTVNGVEIYSRKMEADNSRRFSFYHDRGSVAVQVRNVVMRGNWPEQLTEPELKNLVAPAIR